MDKLIPTLEGAGKRIVRAPSPSSSLPERARLRRIGNVSATVKARTAVTESSATAANPQSPCRSVYEPDPDDPQTMRLVLTPYMLLDWLKDCEEEAAELRREVERKNLGWERRHGLPVNPIAERLERLHFGVSHLLKLLWRSGLWTDEEVLEAQDAGGQSFRVLSEPFRDGKPGGRPLSAHAPDWQRELLGLPPQDGAKPDK